MKMHIKIPNLFKQVMAVSMAASILMAGVAYAEDTQTKERYIDQIVKAAQNPFLLKNSGTEYINPFTGNLKLNYTDLSLPGKNGLNLDLVREYNSQESNLSNILSNSQIVDNSNEMYYDIGAGWSFDFPYLRPVEGADSMFELNLGSRGSFVADLSVSDPTKVFENYKINDMKFVLRQADFVSNGVQSFFTLTYKNGLNYYFADEGYLLGIKDKYGNTIRFEYTIKPSEGLHGKKYLVSKIYDTVGRVVNFDYTADQLTVSVSGEGKSKTVTYGFKKATSVTSVRPQTMPFLMDDTDRVLDSVTDPLGQKTNYSYQFMAGKKDFETKVITDDSNDYVYALLSGVNHPGGAVSTFEYKTSVKNLGDGAVEFFKVGKRYETIKDELNTPITINTVTYNYAQNQSTEYDGYPNNYPSGVLPSDFRIRVSVTDDRGITDYVGNQNYSLVKVETTNKDVKTVEERIYDDSDQLKTKIFKNYCTTLGGGTGYLKTVEHYQFDEKGNMIGYWDPQTTTKLDALLNEIPENDEHKTTFTYDNRYGMQLSKTYKQTAANTVEERNTLSADGKSIVRSEIYANSALKTRQDIGYDAYGNVIHVTAYDDGFTKANHQYYSYAGTGKDALVSKSWTDALQNSDGQDIGIVQTETTYDYFGNAIQTKDGNGNVSSITYDNIDRPLTVSNPDGTNSSIQYENLASGFQLIKTDENNNPFKLTYDSLGRQLKVIDVTSGKTLANNSYDSLGRVIKTTDALGNYTETIYRLDDSVQEKKSFDKNGTLLSHVKYTKTVAENDSPYVKIIEEKVGDQYALSQFKTTYINTLGQTEKNTVKIGENSYSEYFKYDYAGRQIEFKSAKIDAEGLAIPYTWKKEYDHAGNPVKIYNANGDFASQKYNALGQLIEVTDYKGNKAQTAYSTKMTYDGLGRLIKEEKPFEIRDGLVKYSTNLYDYDSNGNVITQKTSINKSTEASQFSIKRLGYDSRNRLVLTTLENAGSPVLYSQYYYDGVGNQLRMYTGLSSPLTITGLDQVSGIDTSYSVTKMTYDHLGNLTQFVDPMNQTEIYSYDDNGNLTGILDRNKTQFVMNYDGLGRLISKTGTGKAGKTTELTNVYNFVGSLKYVVADGKRTNYTYDNAGRLTNVTETGHDKNYTYDVLGNRKSFQLDSLLNTSYTYDVMDRLTEVSEGGVREAAYTYDANGNRESLKYGAGTFGTNYVYNLANQVTSLSNFNGNTTPGDGTTLSNILPSYTYEYRLDGNRVSETESTNNTLKTYSFDDLSRMIQEAKNLNGKTPEALSSKILSKDAPNLLEDYNATYVFDDYGNIQTKTLGETTTTYSYDKNSRVIKESKTTGGVTQVTRYTYDANGNTLSERTETYKAAGTAVKESLTQNKPSVTINEYNLLNQLVKVNNDKGVTTFSYNASGLRTGKESGYGTYQYVWDGQNLVAEYRNGSLLATYLYGSGTQILRKDAATGKKHYYFYNAHCDVTALTDNTGKVATVYDYDAYGQDNARGEQIVNPFKYFGQYYDQETGSYYLRARYYDANLMRFTSEDTYTGKANDPLSLNRYLYCSTNPVLYIDPSGHDKYRQDHMKDAQFDAAVYYFNYVLTEDNIEAFSFATMQPEFMYFSKWASEYAALLREAQAAQNSIRALESVKKLVDPKLMKELAESGSKYTAKNILMITKNADGKLMWLETGNAKAGLQHIAGHTDDLLAKGIGIDDVPAFIKDKLLTQKAINVGSNSKGLYADYIVEGQKYRLAYGSNGYIVSLYPIK